LTPDRIPGIGYLDDAIMVELGEGSLELAFGVRILDNDDARRI
jgi:uncharacterized membrane protein YkvA (DUF1232 family)